MSCFGIPSHGQAPRVVYRASAGAALVVIGEGAKLSPALCLGVALDADEPVTHRDAPLAPLTASASELYATLAAHGLVVEPAFRALRSARFEGTRAEFWLERPAAEAGAGFILGPSVLDAALHAALLVAGQQLPDAPSVWPALDELWVAHPAAVSRLTLELRARSDASVLLDVALWDAAGAEVARLAGVRVGTDSWQARRSDLQLRALFRRIVRACVPVPELDDETSLATLGVSSIDLVRISSQAQDWLGWSPQLAEFLATPTIAGLVALYRKAEAGAGEPAPKLVRTLSAIESQLWFLERLTNAAGSYNEGFAWRIQGPIVPDVLERALQLVQRRHPALCSYFPAEQGKPTRRLDWRQCTLELAPLPDDVRRTPELLARCLEDSVCRPFDLEREPAFRCVLFLHAAHDATLVLTAHHLICDAWSLGRVLVPELSAAYDAILQGTAPELPSPVDALDRRADAPDYAADAAAHYRSELRDVPHVLDFPFDHPRPAQQTHRGACLRRTLPASRWRAVKALARELAVSPFVLGLALYEVLLHRYTRQPEFCLGVPVSLRRGGTDERAIGCMVNVGVIAARVDLARDLRAHCSAVHAAFVDMLRFERFSLGEIVRAVAPERSLSHTPLVQAVFGYRELTGPDLTLSGCQVTAQPVHNQRAKFDLALALDDRGESATLSLEYASDLLDARSAERLLDHFEQLLEDALHKPGARLAELTLSPRAERQLIAASEQGPSREVPAYALGVESLASYAQDAVVLWGARRALRAHELRAAVGQLSDALRARGVGAGELVALCLPRSPEWVIAALAVLDAGAAYAPFDPTQPRARIVHGIASCGARLVLTRDDAYRPEPGAGISVLDLADFDRFEHSAERKRPAVQRGAARPVYAILTSGSTGQPRAAKVAYAGLCNLLAWYSEVLQLTAADRVLFATSVGFDLTQKNLLATLL
ncbi:MAG TPA: condensation domain-containing protein, partial [Polyangiales bacterium]|nr:condensation domain-containing protein [Polyangiales bacterium]